MKTLTIKWQRLVEGGETCPRCGSTGGEVRKASEILGRALAPLGIEVVLNEVEIDLKEFERQPLASNHILIGGRAIEEWLGGTTGRSPCCTVCGPNDCRTLTVDGRTHETIPADLIIRAGLLAAASLTSAGAEEPCCAPGALGVHSKEVVHAASFSRVMGGAPPIPPWGRRSLYFRSQGARTTRRLAELG
jgi:Domain of unknown function (DUF2703)